MTQAMKSEDTVPPLTWIWMRKWNQDSWGYSFRKTCLLLAYQ